MIGHLLSEVTAGHRVLMSGTHPTGIGVVIVDEGTEVPPKEPLRLDLSSVTVTPTYSPPDKYTLTITNRTPDDSFLIVEPDRAEKRQQRRGNPHYRPFYMDLPKPKRGRKHR